VFSRARRHDCGSRYVRTVRDAVGDALPRPRRRDPGVYSEQVIATLREPLDERHFLRAWQRVVERHPVLRSRFRWEGVEQPVQEVLDRVGLPVERFDWRALRAAERQQRLQALADHERSRGFALDQAPLMRLVLVRAAEREHWVLWTTQWPFSTAGGLYFL
jgi:condensation domain-containing protein